MRFYLDGAADGSPGRVSAVGGAAADLGIGARNGNFPYKGLLDDVRIYKRVLDAAEAFELHRTTITGGYGDLAWSRKWWPVGAAAAGGSVLPQMLQHGLYAGTAL